MLGRKGFHNWLFEEGNNSHSGWTNKVKMYPVIFKTREFGAGDLGSEGTRCDCLPREPSGYIKHGLTWLRQPLPIGKKFRLHCVKKLVLLSLPTNIDNNTMVINRSPTSILLLYINFLQDNER